MYILLYAAMHMVAGSRRARHCVRLTYRPSTALLLPWEPKNIPQKVSCVMINKADFTLL